MKNEEYIADFCLVSRRELSELEYRIFRYHFLLGAEWKLCCGRLKIDRGEFFHHIYRIEQKLGRAFRELEPYALFPLDEYFSGGTKEAKVIHGLFKVETEKQTPAKRLLKFPIKKAA